MTFDRAATILQEHGHQWMVSSLPGHIRGLVEWTHVNGTSGADWEDIELSAKAILDWLEY